MDNTDALNTVVAEYEKLRSDNEKQRDTRVSKVYERVPEIEEIDKKIAEIGSSTLKEILANPDKSGLKEDMKSKFTVLKQRRREILAANSIPEDFDKIRYRCDICKDTGHIDGGGKCGCFSQRLIDCMYKQSGIGELIKTQSFDKFRLDYYSRERSGDKKFSPYENMERIKSYCERYADEFDKTEKSLCFYGDTGLGKTFMSCCVAKAVMDKGKSVLYIRASKLFRMMDDERFGKADEGIDEVYNCDLLVIDDLGAETETRSSASNLLELVNDRMINNKKMIINTNLNFEGMEKRYSKRFSSRLLENFTVMIFYGDDIRRKKMK